MDGLDITVIIPVKNGAEYILECVESALNQSAPAAEVIVVDDGSTDGTRELIEQEFGSRVRVLIGPRLGAGPARNVGVAEAGTRLVAFLDADDIWHPEKLSKQLSVFEPGTLLGTYSNYFVSSRTGKRFLGTSIRTATNQEAARMIKDGGGMPVLLSSWLFEKESFANIGGFDPEFLFAQDFEIALRLAKNGTAFKVLRESLVDYRIHASSETYQNYIMQTKFAAYSIYKVVNQGKLDWDTWINLFWSKSHMRRARAGFYFRLALANLGSPIPIRSFSYLLASFLLDSRGFVTKFVRQSDIKLSLGLKR
jgi:glycosyltransferase involved in cell wall biosynthesis